MNTWTGENTDEYTTNYVNVGANQADGAFHTYRFEWHTGDAAGNGKRVDFFVDGVLKITLNKREESKPRKIAVS